MENLLEHCKLIRVETDLDPWLIVQMADVELPDWRMWQHLVMLLQDLVKALDSDTRSFFKLPNMPQMLVLNFGTGPSSTWGEAMRPRWCSFQVDIHNITWELLPVHYRSSPIAAAQQTAQKASARSQLQTPSDPPNSLAEAYSCLRFTSQDTNKR